MGDYTIIRKCSTMCTMHEPCSISESGLCAQNNKRPVDYDALAVAFNEKMYARRMSDVPYLEQVAAVFKELLP